MVYGGFTVAWGEMWLIGGRLAKFICWVNGKRKALGLGLTVRWIWRGMGLAEAIPGGRAAA